MLMLDLAPGRYLANLVHYSSELKSSSDLPASDSLVAPWTAQVNLKRSTIEVKNLGYKTLEGPEERQGTQ